MILQSFPPMSVYQRSTPWWQGYPALAMSDTSESRDPNYHRTTDTADKLNYEEMARLAELRRPGTRTGVAKRKRG